MSKVEKHKKKLRSFLEEQYRELVPKRVKGLGAEFEKRRPMLRESYKSRKVKGRTEARRLVESRLPFRVPRRKGKKRK